MSELAAYTKNTWGTTSESVANELVTAYASLVKRIAYHLMNRLPPCVQVDDLVQAGMIGLLEAARKYDTSQGASFETYATIRVRGAMLDEIRKGNWAPRSLHRKIREISQAIREIECDQGRNARDTEVSKRLNMSLNEYYQVLQDANSHQILSFDHTQLGENKVADSVAAKIPGPMEHLQREDMENNLARAISTLPEREKLVVSLYYNKELNLREVGNILGVTESRVCQIHAQALLRLRARMSGMMDKDDDNSR